MAGLTSSGFVPETYANIKARIEGKLETLNPGFDFSPESPDGQNIGIMTYEIFQCWSQLNNVYNSNNPSISSGAALRNIGLHTGIPFGAASKSYVTLETQGTAGTVIPALSFFSDDAGNEFYSAFAVAIPSNIQAVSVNSGVLDVSASTVTTIVTPVTGLDSITQTSAGNSGTVAQTQQQYRNSRQRTVMRNSTSVADAMKANLLELGIEQATVFNNDSNSAVGSVPANTIEVTVGEISPTITNEMIAQVILSTNSMGCPTYGTTAVVLTDTQGVEHTVSFTKAVQFDVEIDLNVTFLSTEFAGAEEGIKASLVAYINGLASGEDIIWSRLFAYITPYGEAQINSLDIGEQSGTLASSNIVIADDKYSNLADTDITITVV
tara:strand:+ start:32 stop:1171 length:1140 start_codon:yes stop_codon:yes gene_type:complete